jgi:peptide subunit release factor 1 (eRF1)
VHQRQPFDHLLIICSDELRPVIRPCLHHDLLDVLAGMIDADLVRASPDEIAQAVAPFAEQAEREREHMLVEVLDQTLATGGAAAAGLDEVLSTLEQRRIQTLVVPARSSMKVGLCPTCARLSTDGSRKCRLDGDALAEVDVVEYAIEKAARQSAQVVVLHRESEWLREHGEIAALLRW